ncbi:hypothetical protein [Undibacterium terreum]|nr:hypothetical protein [Undibacterium terreum]
MRTRLGRVIWQVAYLSRRIDLADEVAIGRDQITLGINQNLIRLSVGH